MICQKVTIINKTGIHARPANLFVKTALSFDSDVCIKKDEKKYSGKSIISVMSAGMKFGDEIELITDGSDEQAAISRLTEIVETGLGEADK